MHTALDLVIFASYTARPTHWSSHEFLLLRFIVFLDITYLNIPHSLVLCSSSVYLYMATYVHLPQTFPVLMGAQVAQTRISLLTITSKSHTVILNFIYDDGMR